MTLRPATVADAAAIAAIYAPHVLAGVASFELDAPDAAAMAARMTAAGNRYPWLVATRGPAVIGYAYAGAFNARDAYRWSVETTIYVGTAGQRQGIGRRLYAALLATLTAQGFAQAIGRIALPNGASVALHESLGFDAAGVYRAVGWKAGRWIDVGIWQAPLTALAHSPAEPKPFTQVGLIVL